LGARKGSGAAFPYLLAPAANHARIQVMLAADLREALFPALELADPFKLEGGRILA